MDFHKYHRQDAPLLLLFTLNIIVENIKLRAYYGFYGYKKEKKREHIYNNDNTNTKWKKHTLQIGQYQHKKHEYKINNSDT